MAGPGALARNEMCNNANDCNKRFIKRVHLDIKEFADKYEENSVLIFPKLNTRFGYHIHMIAQAYSLASFAIGKGDYRVTIVCHSEILMRRHKQIQAEKKFTKSQPTLHMTIANEKEKSIQQKKCQGKFNTETEPRVRTAQQTRKNANEEPANPMSKLAEKVQRSKTSIRASSHIEMNKSPNELQPSQRFIISTADSDFEEEVLPVEQRPKLKPKPQRARRHNAEVILLTVEEEVASETLKLALITSKDPDMVIANEECIETVDPDVDLNRKIKCRTAHINRRIRTQKKCAWFIEASRYNTGYSYLYEDAVGIAEANYTIEIHKKIHYGSMPPMGLSKSVGSIAPYDNNTFDNLLYNTYSSVLSWYSYEEDGFFYISRGLDYHLFEQWTESSRVDDHDTNTPSTLNSFVPNKRLFNPNAKIFEPNTKLFAPDKKTSTSELKSSNIASKPSDSDAGSSESETHTSGSNAIPTSSDSDSNSSDSYKPTDLDSTSSDSYKPSKLNKKSDSHKPSALYKPSDLDTRSSESYKPSDTIAEQSDIETNPSDSNNISDRENSQLNTVTINFKPNHSSQTEDYRLPSTSTDEMEDGKWGDKDDYLSGNSPTLFATDDLDVSFFQDTPNNMSTIELPSANPIKKKRTVRTTSIGKPSVQAMKAVMFNDKPAPKGKPAAKGKSALKGKSTPKGKPARKTIHKPKPKPGLGAKPGNLRKPYFNLSAYMKMRRATLNNNRRQQVKNAGRATQSKLPVQIGNQEEILRIEPTDHSEYVDIENIAPEKETAIIPPSLVEDDKEDTKQDGDQISSSSSSSSSCSSSSSSSTCSSCSLCKPCSSCEVLESSTNNLNNEDSKETLDKEIAKPSASPASSNYSNEISPAFSPLSIAEKEESNEELDPIASSVVTEVTVHRNPSTDEQFEDNSVPQKPEDQDDDQSNTNNVEQNADDKSSSSSSSSSGSSSCSSSCSCCPSEASLESSMDKEQSTVENTPVESYEAMTVVENIGTTPTVCTDRELEDNDTFFDSISTHPAVDAAQTNENAEFTDDSTRFEQSADSDVLQSDVDYTSEEAKQITNSSPEKTDEVHLGKMTHAVTNLGDMVTNLKQNQTENSIESKLLVNPETVHELDDVLLNQKTNNQTSEMIICNEQDNSKGIPTKNEQNNAADAAANESIILLPSQTTSEANEISDSKKICIVNAIRDAQDILNIQLTRSRARENFCIDAFLQSLTDDNGASKETPSTQDTVSSNDKTITEAGQESLPPASTNLATITEEVLGNINNEPQPDANDTASVAVETPTKNWWHSVGENETSHIPDFNMEDDEESYTPSSDDGRYRIDHVPVPDDTYEYTEYESEEDYEESDIELNEIETIDTTPPVEHSYLLKIDPFIKEYYEQINPHRCLNKTIDTIDLTNDDEDYKFINTAKTSAPIINTAKMKKDGIAVMFLPTDTEPESVEVDICPRLSRSNKTIVYIPPIKAELEEECESDASLESNSRSLDGSTYKKIIEIYKKGSKLPCTPETILEDHNYCGSVGTIHRTSTDSARSITPDVETVVISSEEEEEKEIVIVEDVLFEDAKDDSFIMEYRDTETMQEDSDVNKDNLHNDANDSLEEDGNSSFYESCDDGMCSNVCDVADSVREKLVISDDTLSNIERKQIEGITDCSLNILDPEQYSEGDNKSQINVDLLTNSCAERSVPLITDASDFLPDTEIIYLDEAPLELADSGMNSVNNSSTSSLSSCESSASESSVYEYVHRRKLSYDSGISLNGISKKYPFYMDPDNKEIGFVTNEFTSVSQLSLCGDNGAVEDYDFMNSYQPVDESENQSDNNRDEGVDENCLGENCSENAEDYRSGEVYPSEDESEIESKDYRSGEVHPLVNENKAQYNNCVEGAENYKPENIYIPAKNCETKSESNEVGKIVHQSVDDNCVVQELENEEIDVDHSHIQKLVLRDQLLEPIDAIILQAYQSIVLTQVKDSNTNQMDHKPKIPVETTCYQAEDVLPYQPYFESPACNTVKANEPNLTQIENMTEEPTRVQQCPSCEQVIQFAIQDPETPDQPFLKPIQVEEATIPETVMYKQPYVNNAQDVDSIDAQSSIYIPDLKPMYIVSVVDQPILQEVTINQPLQDSMEVMDDVVEKAQSNINIAKPTNANWKNDAIYFKIKACLGEIKMQSVSEEFVNSINSIVTSKGNVNKTSMFYVTVRTEIEKFKKKYSDYRVLTFPKFDITSSFIIFRIAEIFTLACYIIGEGSLRVMLICKRHFWYAPISCVGSQLLQTEIELQLQKYIDLPLYDKASTVLGKTSMLEVTEHFKQFAAHMQLSDIEDVDTNEFCYFVHQQIREFLLDSRQPRALLCPDMNEYQRFHIFRCAGLFQLAVTTMRPNDVIVYDPLNCTQELTKEIFSRQTFELRADAMEFIPKSIPSPPESIATESTSSEPEPVSLLELELRLESDLEPESSSEPEFQPEPNLCQELECEPESEYDSQSDSYENESGLFLARYLNENQDDKDNKFIERENELTWKLTLYEDVLDEILDHVGFEAQLVTVKQENYREFDEDASFMRHIVEMYAFPSKFRTRDLVRIVNSYKIGHFRVKWVNDTHALIIFDSFARADRLLECYHRHAKFRAFHDGSPAARARGYYSPDVLSTSYVKEHTSTFWQNKS